MVLHHQELLGERKEYRMINREKLEEIAKQIRRDIVEMTYASGVKGAHLGGSMSMAEILAVLYGSVLKYDIVNPMERKRSFDN